MVLLPVPQTWKLVPPSGPLNVLCALWLPFIARELSSVTLIKVVFLSFFTLYGHFLNHFIILSFFTLDGYLPNSIMYICLAIYCFPVPSIKCQLHGSRNTDQLSHLLLNRYPIIFLNNYINEQIYFPIFFSNFRR